jgi:hypothetical protein
VPGVGDATACCVGVAATMPDDAAASPQADHWRGPAVPQPDWQGAARDAGHFVAYQAVGVAVLYMLPEHITGWDNEAKKADSFSNWRYNVTHPQWDQDSAFVNYVMHPYWGGAYYTRARERGLDGTQAFWYSAMMSALWEYGAEALVEPVSIQDLIVTPVLGSAVGEYLFKPWRARIRAKPGELDWSDTAVLVLTDPLGAINTKLDQWLGAKTTLQMQPTAMRLHTAAQRPHFTGARGQTREPLSGWHMQLRVEW